MKDSRLVIDGRLIQLFVENWNYRTSGYEHITINDINYGWCYQVAILLQKIYGGRLITPGSRHAWVRIKGVEYDSEHMSGGNISKTYRRWSERQVQKNGLIAPMRREDFINLWSDIGNSGMVRMDIIDSTIDDYLTENDGMLPGRTWRGKAIAV